MSTRPKTGTASDGHHKNTTRHATTPPLRKKKPKGRGGANPTTSNTRTPPRHRRPPRTRRETNPAHIRDHAPKHPSQGKTGEQTKPKPTHTHTTPPGMAGCKRTQMNAHTPHHPECQGTAETGGQHTRPHRTPQLGRKGYKRGAHTSTHTPQHPSQEWRGAAATQAPAHTPAPHPQPGGAGD